MTDTNFAEENAALRATIELLLAALNEIADEQKIYLGHGDYTVMPVLSGEAAQALAREALSSLDEDRIMVDRKCWSTIVSAPTDGRRVMLWNAKWHAPSSGQYYGRTVGWGTRYEDIFKHQPTHWRLLPEPPEPQP